MKGKYRLTTQFTGPNKALDVINDGTNNELQMADLGNYSGQYWTLTKSNNWYRLTNDFTP